MTYKNIRFDDSPVMRSLEKIAVKKGLASADPVIKTASTRVASLAPTENFEENVLKLCSALRDSGFVKEANEVETNFFNFKRAQYAVHSEKGEDLIGAAHPDGSHQMKDVEGDAMIETIFDAQKAAKDMIAKMPTGKFAAIRDLADIVKSSSKLGKDNAVNAVKVILSQATDPNKIITDSLSKLRRILSLSLDYSDKELTLAGNWLSEFDDYAQNPTIDNINKINKLIGDYKSRITPSSMAGITTGVTSETWMRLKPLLDQYPEYIRAALEARKEIVTKDNDKMLHPEQAKQEDAPAPAPNVLPETEVTANPAVAKIDQKIVALSKRLKGFLPTINSYDDEKDRATGMKWVQDKIALVNKIQKLIHDTADDQVESVLPQAQRRLDTAEKEINEFYNYWVA